MFRLLYIKYFITYGNIILILEYIALKIQHNRDKTIDPCTDFYKHSCGDFANGKYVSPLNKMLRESKKLKVAKLRYKTDLRIKST